MGIGLVLGCDEGLRKTRLWSHTETNGGCYNLFEMRNRFGALLDRLTWEQRFMIASLVILVAGMEGIGAWITSQIEAGVVHRTGETAAVYMDSAVAPLLQNLATGGEIGADETRKLDDLFRTTPLGQQIYSFKVWNRQGRVLYATSPAIVGHTFPIVDGLARGLQGQVAAEISSLENEENVSERARGRPLLEIYGPVRHTGSDEVIAVAEFYQSVDDLQSDLAASVRQTWLVVGAITLGMYLLLAGFVRRASSTIARQQTELSTQVQRLQELLRRNAELDERVRRAAAQSTALNERFLRRISAELHDGPAQDLGLALLKLDNVIARSEAQHARTGEGEDEQDLSIVNHSLDHALKEIRAISSGMGVPNLNHLGLSEIVARVVRTHERRTSTHVEVVTEGLPARATLPVKIALYRIIQEALTNAFRHASGAGQQVIVRANAGILTIQISDEGPGANGQTSDEEGEHLGLVGMRERVESLGGDFQFSSIPGHGARVTASMPLESESGHD